MTELHADDRRTEAHRARVEEFMQVQKFIGRVKKIAQRNPQLAVYALTLTFPDWASPVWFFPAAHQLAEVVAEVEGDSIWLMVDKGDNGGIHWHAIALSSERAPEWFGEWWASKTGASRDAAKVTFVKGQEDRDSRKFEMHLARAILYRCKDAPGLGLDLADRAVAFGPLRTAWKKSVRRRMADRYLLVQHDGLAGKAEKAVSGARGSVARERRICARSGCGLAIPDSKPAHTKYHDPKCKARDFRERKRTGGGGGGLQQGPTGKTE